MTGTDTGLRLFLCPGRKIKGEGVRGTACSGGYKGVRAVRLESVAGGGWFEVLWNLECPVGLSQREIWCNLDGPLKNNDELWSYIVKFEFSRPKSS